MGILLQLLFNGIIAGGIYALVASGFSLIYNVTKFMHFAHGSVVAVGAYLFFLFARMLELDFILSIILALLCTALFGVLLDYLVHKPLRARKASNAVQLIASLALFILINSAILAIFGADVKSIPITNPILVVADARITVLQVVIIFVAAVFMLLLYLLMKKTRLGIALRALANNNAVAQAVGVNPQKMYSATFFIGSLLAGAAGILIGLEQNLFPEMGTMMIIKGFTGAVIGGIVSVPASIVGSLFLGIVENFGIWWLPSGYKDAIAFSLLFLFLLFKPNGFFGGKK